MEERKMTGNAVRYLKALYRDERGRSVDSKYSETHWRKRIKYGILQVMHQIIVR
jgi:hypothetical protein